MNEHDIADLLYRAFSRLELLDANNPLVDELAEAAAAWNRRPSPAPAGELQAAAQAVLDDFDGFWRVRPKTINKLRAALSTPQMSYASDKDAQMSDRQDTPVEPQPVAGFKLVPIEPTREMLAALVHASLYSGATRAWKDALAAAPPSPPAVVGTCDHMKGNCPQCHQCLIDAGKTSCPTCEPAPSATGIAPGAALTMVSAQAEDAGLWGPARTVVEDYLQTALRRLHAAVEHDAKGIAPVSCEKDARWKTIASAPKDGTEILVWRKDCGVFMARYCSPNELASMTDKERDELDEESLFQQDWFGGDADLGGFRCDGSEVPSHWMPVPSGPEGDSDA